VALLVVAGIALATAIAHMSCLEFRLMLWLYCWRFTRTELWKDASSD